MIELRPIISANALNYPINATLKIDGKIFQAIEIQTDEKINAPYIINIKIIVPEKIVPGKEQQDAVLFYQSDNHNREVKSMIWSLGRGMKLYDHKQGDFRVWRIELRPKLYILSEDMQSDIYHGSVSQILHDLLCKAHIHVSIKGASNTDMTLPRYQMSSLDFMHYILSVAKLQYYFNKGALFISKDLPISSQLHKLSSDDVLDFQEYRFPSPKTLITNKWNRMYSLRSETKLSKIGVLDIIYEEHIQHKEVSHDILTTEFVKITILNHVHIEIGDYISLDGEFEGIVYDMKHNISLQNGLWIYKSHIKLTKIKSYPLQYKFTQSAVYHTATVLDKSSTDDYGCVPIKYIWQKSDVTVLAQVSMMNFGHDKRGLVMMPRVGDEVLVIDLLHPVIIGAIPNAENKFDKQQARESSFWIGKSLSKSSKKVQNAVILSDAAEKEAVKIQCAKDFELTVQNHHKTMIQKGAEFAINDGDLKYDINGNITENASGEYLINAKSVEIVCGMNSLKIVNGKIILNASGDIELNGMNIKLNAKNQVEINALNSVSVDGKVSANLKGGATATVEGGGFMIVKGGFVKIN